MPERRPSRARMCNVLYSALAGVRTLPANPTDIAKMRALAVEADAKLRDLRLIVSEMGWHADADLDFAWQLLQEYEEKWR